MNDIDINNDNICNLYKNIFSIKEKINSLSLAISRVDKADLTNTYLLNDTKTIIDNYNKLEIELLEYKVEITLRLLSIDPEELKNQFDISEEYYDDSSYISDGFNYVTDPEELEARFKEGLLMVKSIGHQYERIMGIPVLEAQNYIVSQIEEIWNNENYSPREKSVNATLKLLELGSLIGVRPGYNYNGGRGNPDGTRGKVGTITMSCGSDCNNSVSWSIWGNPNTDGAWMSCPEFAEAGREISYESLQPGDIAVRGIDDDGTGGHVVFIIENKPETGECIISEEQGPETGAQLRTVKYKDLEDDGLLPRDMGCYYGE